VLQSATVVLKRHAQNDRRKKCGDNLKWQQHGCLLTNSSVEFVATMATKSNLATFTVALCQPRPRDQESGKKRENWTADPKSRQVGRHLESTQRALVVKTTPVRNQLHSMCVQEKHVLSGISVRAMGPRGMRECVGVQTVSAFYAQSLFGDTIPAMPARKALGHS
jgi:hypothetical protein